MVQRIEKEGQWDQFFVRWSFYLLQSSMMMAWEAIAGFRYNLLISDQLRY